MLDKMGFCPFFYSSLSDIYLALFGCFPTFATETFNHLKYSIEK